MQRILTARHPLLLVASRITASRFSRYSRRSKATLHRNCRCDQIHNPPITWSQISDHQSSDVRFFSSERLLSIQFIYQTTFQNVSMPALDQIIYSVISGTHNDDAAINSAASSITTEVQDSKDKEQVEDKVYMFMKSTIRSIRDIPASDNAQDRLVSLLKSLKSTGSLDGERFQTWAGTVWTDLPLLGSEIRDAWNVSSKDTTAEQWANMNAFAARLTVTGLEDLSLYGIWCFRSALESEDEPVDYGLPATLVWLEYAGSSIVEWGRQQRDFAPKADNQPNPAKLGPLAKDAGIESPGYSNQRWQFWTQRLQEISSRESGNVAQLASEAFQKMESLKDASS